MMNNMKIHKYNREHNQETELLVAVANSLTLILSVTWPWSQVLVSFCLPLALCGESSSPSSLCRLTLESATLRGDIMSSKLLKLGGVLPDRALMF